MTICTAVRPAAGTATWTPRRRPALLGELLVVLCLLKVYDLARAAADVRRTAALGHGRAILHVEGLLRIGVEQAANVWTGDHRSLALAASNVYQYAHLPVTLGVLTLVWLRRPDLYRAARNALVAINVCGLTVFLLFPVAPPRLLPGGGFVDVVSDAGLGTSHSGPIHADQYGAMPSLHVAWAVWSTIVVLRLLAGRTGRQLCWLYPLVVTAVVIVTANHYLLDAAAGALVALAALDRPALVSLLRRGWPAAMTQPAAPAVPAQ